MSTPTPYPNKPSLIGSCARLPITIDAEKLAIDINVLPESIWGTTGNRVGVHRQVEAFFLRGYAPVEGDRPISDRVILDKLPYCKEIIFDIIPASPQRCLIARVRPGGVVAIHVDKGDYLSRNIRLHFPVITNPGVDMFCNKQIYHMKPGEVWALNNSAPHGVVNHDPLQPRIHMICDFSPEFRLLELLNNGDKTLGKIGKPESFG